MTKGQLQIHSQNILPIIKKWLYSEKEIFVRELISNACDAIVKRSILDKDNKAAPRIEVKIDKEAKTITFSDNGIGMEKEETEKYLAQIAFSGAEEFVKTYQTNDAFIGHFGLGFYSAYMVAEKVDVITRSFKEGSDAVLWSCDGSSEYEITPATRSEVGTDVILHISKENEEYLENDRLFDLVKRFCLFLPYPIFVNETLVNSKEPLWQKSASQTEDKDYREFYSELYPMEEEPLFWVHLNVDYPFHVKGILYFPRINKDFDFTKSHVKLFCNRVFVSEDCKDILPDYLQILKGVIDSPDIPLNVSRSHLQVDKTVRALSGHISKKVVDALSVLYKNERERFYNVWEDSSTIVKLGMLNDDKFFQKAKEFLIWKTSKGSWVTLDEYLANNPETIFYTTEEQLSSPLVHLYEDKGIDILITKEPLDAPLMSMLERGASFKFMRIDSSVQANLLDPSREKSLLDAEGKTESEHMAAFFRKSLNHLNIDVEAKSINSTDVSAFISVKEEERRLRDYLARISKEAPQQSMAKKTLVINTNSPLVASLYKMQTSEPELAKLMAEELYDLTALSQRELDPKEMKTFLKRSSTLLEKVALFATKK